MVYTRMQQFSLLLMAVLGLSFASCQQNEYRIEGTIEGISDGDTLILTDNMSESTPLKKIIVKNGTFETSGKADSTMFCAIYVSSTPGIYLNFFLEPGTIKLHMAREISKSRVSGTKSNVAWQQLNETIASYNDRMHKLAVSFYSENLAVEEQQATMEKLQAVEEEMVDKVIEAAEKNIDNELGFFIVTHFDAESHFTPTRRSELIKRMPSKFRQRSAIKELEAMLAHALATEKGNKIDDFSLPTPAGEQLSIMDIVSQHKLTILDFWASWCGPCRQEMPNMVDLYKQYQPKGLAIIGISLDSDRTAWTNAIKDMGLTWTHVSDLKGWQSAAAVQFNVTSIPQVILLDQQGVIVGKNLRGRQIRTIVAETLKD